MPDHEFVISTQVLLELYVVITRKLRPALPEQAAAEVITSLCRLPVVGTDAALVQRAVALAKRHQLSVWDALDRDSRSRGGLRGAMDRGPGDGRRDPRRQDPQSSC